MPNIHLAELKHARYFQQALRECHRLYRAGTDKIMALEHFDLDWGNIQIGRNGQSIMLNQAAHRQS